MPPSIVPAVASGIGVRRRVDAATRLRRFPVRYRNAVKDVAGRHRRLADLALALVDVVHDIVGDAVEHAVDIAATERRAEAQHQCTGAIRSARAIDDHEYRSLR